jgi:hypothetical protein
LSDLSLSRTSLCLVVRLSDPSFPNHLSFWVSIRVTSALVVWSSNLFAPPISVPVQ